MFCRRSMVGVVVLTVVGTFCLQVGAVRAQGAASSVSVIELMFSGQDPVFAAALERERVPGRVTPTVLAAVVAAVLWAAGRLRRARPGSPRQPSRKTATRARWRRFATTGRGASAKARDGFGSS